MKHRNMMLLAEVVLALVCLTIQVCIVRLVQEGRRNAAVGTTAASMTTALPELAREAVPRGRQGRRLPQPGVRVDRQTHRLDRMLLGQRRLLDRLLSREEFLEWSAQGLEMLGAYKQAGNADWTKFPLRLIDTEQPDWQEKLSAAMEERQQRFDNANQALDLLAREDFASLDNDDFDFFTEVFETVSLWVNCMDDDQVYPEEKAEALQHYNELMQEYRDQVWHKKRPDPLRTSFVASHGDAIGRYQTTRMFMQLDELWDYGAIHGTNVYYFQRFDSELKANRKFKVLLDEE